MGICVGRLALALAGRQFEVVLAARRRRASVYLPI
jgi:hypothetical protein